MWCEVQSLEESPLTGSLRVPAPSRQITASSLLGFSISGGALLPTGAHARSEPAAAVQPGTVSGLATLPSARARRRSPGSSGTSLDLPERSRTRGRSAACRNPRGSELSRIGIRFRCPAQNAPIRAPARARESVRPRSVWRELGCARMSTRTSRGHIYDKFAHGQVAGNLWLVLCLRARRVRMASARKNRAGWT